MSFCKQAVLSGPNLRFPTYALSFLVAELSRKGLFCSCCLFQGQLLLPKEQEMNERSATMSDSELKDYMLTHREDQEAFHIYIDRVNTRPGEWHLYSDYSVLEELLSSKRCVLRKNRR